MMAETRPLPNRMCAGPEFIQILTRSRRDAPPSGPSFPPHGPCQIPFKGTSRSARSPTHLSGGAERFAETGGTHRANAREESTARESPSPFPRRRIFRRACAELPHVAWNRMLLDWRERIMCGGEESRSDADDSRREPTEATSSPAAGMARTDKAIIEDTKLIRRVRAGERELYYELVAPHERKIYIMAFSILRTQSEAEDCVQDTVFT